jgi:hypothetical protein
MLSRAGLFASLAAGLLCLASPASADAQTVGGADVTKPVAKKPRPRAHKRPTNTTGPVATFPGFRVLAGGASRVYVELTAPVAVEQHPTKGTLVYTLKGARVLARNNRNPLITTHFSSPVSRVRLVPNGMDLDVVIELRADAPGTHRIVTDANGTARLEVDFAAGQYALEPSRFTPDPNKPAKPSSKKGDKKSPPAGETIDDEKDQPPVGPPEP